VSLLARVVRATGIRNRILSPRLLEKWEQSPRQPYRGAPPFWLARRIRARRDEREGWPVYEVEARKPERQGRGPVVFLHGGAYVREFDPFMHWRAVAGLAEMLGRPVVVPIYPLAPEHSHRDAFPFLVALYRRLLAAHAPSEIALVGDSAGGGLALALCHVLREAGLPQPSDAVLLSPWLDLALANPAIPEVDARDPVLNAAHARECGRRWADGAPLDDPKLSPVHVPLRGLARVTVFTGTLDILNPDARVLRERAREDGVEIGWLEEHGQLHDWMLSVGGAARRAFREIGRVLARGSSALGGVLDASGVSRVS